VHARAAPALDFEFADRPVVVHPYGTPAQTAARVALIGMQTHSRGELFISGRVDSFIIMFQPAALGLLFSLSAREFTDRGFDAESVVGPGIGCFHERLAECRSGEERVRVADRFLLQRVLDAGVLDGVSAAANQVIRRPGSVRIPAMADSAGLSLRQFERRFLQQVGMSPKLLARIARFEAALDCMARSQTQTWTEVAHRFGYYDQMHMVHEFAEFTGETPKDTLRNLGSVFHSLEHSSHSRLIF
jgi:AraC-like DNA-binding protein